jgi:hypothetical protein
MVHGNLADDCLVEWQACPFNKCAYMRAYGVLNALMFQADLYGVGKH